jgi:hypothetical protein
MFSRRKKSVLLVDFDNVERVGGNLTRRIANWVAWIEEGRFDPAGVERKLLIKRVYWNSQHDRHRVPFERGGFEAVVCQAWRSAKGSSVDFELTIDAIDYAHSLRGLEEVIILAFDTDYLSVVHRLQQKEIEAVLMVTDQSVSDVYRDRANHVISDAQLRAAFDFAPPARGWFGIKKTKPPVNVPGTAAAPMPAKASPAPPIPAGAKSPAIDIDDAVQRLQRAAAQTPSRPLGKRVVCDVLRDVKGFSTIAPNQWLGKRTYYEMIEFLASKSKELKVVKLREGGKAICHKSLKEPTPKPLAP